MKRHVLFIIALLFVAISVSAQTASDYRADAESGDKVAQFNLALCYYNGYGVTKSYVISNKWLLKSAQQGYPAAQFLLGLNYFYGEGITKDYSQAAFWFRKAAEQGDAYVQWRLGNLYENGLGVAKNYSNALYWYRKSAEQNEFRSIVSMGTMYFSGYGVSVDKNTSLYLFKKALQIIEGKSDLSNEDKEYKEYKAFCTGWVNSLQEEGYSASKSQLRFNETPYLTVDNKTDLTSSYSYTGGPYTYTVDTNASDYEVNALPSWCSVSKSGTTFTINCERNSGNSSRSDWFRVKTGDKEVKVHVTQDGDPNAVGGEIENVWIDFNAVQQEFLSYTKGMNIHIKFKTNNLYNVDCIACAFFYYQNGTPLNDHDYLYRTNSGHVYARKSFKPGYTNAVYSDLVIFMPYPQLHMGIGTFNLKFDLEMQENSSGSWKCFARKDDNNFMFYNSGF